MAAGSADRNLLFGILALQLDFIHRDQLVAGMNAWVLNKAQPLGDILIAQGALRPDLRVALDTMVDKHLEVHDQDTQRSLAAADPEGATRVLLDGIADDDVQFSLDHLEATVASAADLQPPTTVGLNTSSGTRFLILRPHARGGLGEVFVAHDTELHREVALKEIQVRHANNATHRARFLMEAEITGGLEHPNIVPVYGLGVHPDGRPYYAMRLIKGDSLRDAIKRFHDKGKSAGETTLELHQLVRRFVDVCNAMQYAHDRGVLHRDLKPGNIMLGKYGETLVVDWGLAKPSHAPRSSMELATDASQATEVPPESILRPSTSSDHTQAGSTVGTPQFMSPEQALGDLERQGPCSDIYSLGACLYCILTGKPPIAVLDPAEALRLAQSGEFALPRQLKPDVPPALEAICVTALAKRPADRYPSCHALAADLERWLADEPVSAYPEPWTRRLVRRVRRHQAVASAAAAGIIVGLVALTSGLFLYQSAQHREAQRRLVAGHAVRAALQQAEQARGELQAALHKTGGVFELANRPENWASQIRIAQAALDQAAAIAGAEPSLALDLKGRAENLQALLDQDDRERQLALRLEKIRLDTAVVRDKEFDFALAAREYPRAFGDAGYSIDEQHRSTSAARIARSAIKEQLIAALDDWALAALFVDKQETAAEVLALTRQAAPDAVWGDRFREVPVWRDQESLTKLVKEAPASGMSPQMLALVGMLLAPDNPLREPWLRAAQSRYPGDFWLNLSLAHALSQSSPVEAAGFCHVCLALRPASPVAHFTLGTLLNTSHKPAEAQTAFAKAIELEPRFAWAHVGLGAALHEQKKVPDAEAALRKALEIDSSLAFAHYALGALLQEQRNVPAARAAFQKAIDSDPKLALAHQALGNLLLDSGQPEEAAAAFRTALALDPESALLHYRLGSAYRELKKPAEAITAYEKALALDPADVRVYNELGNVLVEQDRLAEATSAYRKAAELEPGSANAQYGLGTSLLRQGRLGEASQSLNKALELLAATDPLRALVQQQLSLCDRVLALDRRLPRLLAGKESADAAELLELATVCQMNAKRFLSAARLYELAFKAKPALQDDLSGHYRYNAACAALQAGLGLGEDGAKLPADEKTKLRRQARDWIEADLALYRRTLKGDKGPAVAHLQRDLGFWQEDPDLRAVRDQRQLAALPEDERAAWRRLWDDVAAMLKESRGRQ